MASRCCSRQQTRAGTRSQRVIASYALGSLAHGGFSAVVSDIDLAVILQDPLQAEDAAAIAAVVQREKAKGSQLHHRLSVFWGTPSTLRGERAGGRFPALDRLDLIEHGRLLDGTDQARAGLVPPTTDELIITGAQFALARLATDRTVAEDRVARRRW